MTTTKAMMDPQFEENLHKAANRVREQLANADRNDVQARYAVACICLEVKDEKRFGKDGLAFLQRELKPAKSTLYRYAKVAETWGPAEFKAATGTPNSKDQPLTWSHWELLAAVADDVQRDVLLSRTLKDALSVRDLAAAVRELSPTPPSEDAAKNVAETQAISRAFARHLGALEKEAQDVEARIAARAAGNTRPTPSELSELGSLANQIEAATKALTALAKRVKEVTEQVAPKRRGRAAKVLKGQVAVAQEAATA